MTVAVADRSPRGLVVVHGPDATTFLQSLVSQDLDPIEDGQSAHSLLLTPKGKLDGDFRITKAGDDWWLDTEGDFAPQLAASLTRFRIRVKAEIDDRTADTGMFSIVQPATETFTVAGGGLIESHIALIRTPFGGDILGSTKAVGEALDGLDPEIERWTPEQFDAYRIEAGIPRLGIDMDESTIPQEALLDVDAISFTKGCFLGQELVARIDSRGHVNKYLRRLRVNGTVVPPHGASVVVDDKDVGTVTSAAVVPGEDRVVALGMVRHEVKPPATVTLRWDGGETPAELLAVSEA
jgi:folate-binding protein YgfZ